MIAGMNATKLERKQVTQTGNKHRIEPPWNVVLHNEWENPLRRVILVLRRVIPEMTLKRATRTAWEAHCKGRAVVKRCHKELAELYKNLLQEEGLTVSWNQPARQGAQGPGQPAKLLRRGGRRSGGK
jgi:ATP-dependent Clp protease adaptor protein ClpS